MKLGIETITATKTKLLGKTIKITKTVENEMTQTELSAQSVQLNIQLNSLKNQMSLIKAEYDRVSTIKAETDELLAQFPEEGLPSI